MSFLGFFFAVFLVVTGPIWMMMLMFNLPIILALYFTFFYTNVSTQKPYISNLIFQFVALQPGDKALLENRIRLVLLKHDEQH